MTGYLNIWDELGIVHTTDVRKIKKAYAKKVAICHPEDHPEEFQKLRNAYERALEIAQGNAEGDVFDASGAEYSGQEEVSVEWAVRDENEEEQQTTESTLEQWEKAQHIVEMADRYAKEQERQQERECLYSGFLQSIAAKEIPKYSGKDKLENHDAWVSFLKKPCVLEALRFSDFVKQVENKIILREFHYKTARMIRTVLMKEIPEEFSKRKELQKQLEKKGKREREVWGFVKRWIAVPIVLACVVFAVFQIVQFREQQRALAEYHSIENLEAYMEEKYQINCDVTRADKYDVENPLDIFQQEDENELEYFLVSTEGIDVMPEEFGFSWKKESMDYDDIQDNLRNKTIEMYADQFELKMAMTAVSTADITVDDTITDGSTVNLTAFLRGLQGSQYVKSGHTIVLSIQPGVMPLNILSVEIDKNTVVDGEEMKSALNEWREKASSPFGL